MLFPRRAAIPADRRRLIRQSEQKTAGPNIDVTRPIPPIDLPALVQYGRQRGIGLFVWLNWAHLDAQMDAALAWFERIGLRGIKVDFMNRDKR